MIRGEKTLKSKLQHVFILTMLTLGTIFTQGIVTNAEAGFITGVSRAGGLTCLGNKQESITWDTQLGDPFTNVGIVNRKRYAISYHFNRVNGMWSQQLHPALHSGWVFGWTTGFAASHSERLSYPGVVGDHYTILPRRGVVYNGRTQAINTCDGQPKRFEYDNGSN